MSPRTAVYRRRSSLLGVIAGAATLVLVAGCSSGTPSPSETTGGAGAPGGNLVIGMTSDPNTLLPWKATQFQAVNILQNVYGTLTEFDKDLNVVPGLAQSWDPSADGKTVTLKLRSGVTFADGSAFDSADVKSSMDRIMDEKTAAVARTSLASVASVAAPDPTTVVLTMKSADASLPANLASVNMAMLSSTDTDETLDHQAQRHRPVCVQGPHAEPVAHPAEERVLLGPEGDPRQRRVPGHPRRDVDRVGIAVRQRPDGRHRRPARRQDRRGRRRSRCAKTPQLSYHALQLNARKGDLTDVNVRLAIQCAIDRKQVLDTAALGEGEVTGPVTSPAYKSDPNSRPCPNRDLAKAADYLAKAGKSSVTIKTIVSQGEYATSVNEAQNLKAQLAEAKITLDLQVLESGAYVDRWVAADFDAAVALNGGRPDPDGMYGRYFTSTGNLNKVAGYSLARARRALRAGQDHHRHRRAQADLHEDLRRLEANAVWIWMFTSYTYTVTTPGVQGFVPMVNGSLQYLRTTTVSTS